MELLDALKFARGTVAKRDLLPALTHFRIHDGVIQSYNGVASLRAPVAIDLDVTPKAVPMVRAITNCQEEVALHVTGNGRLAIKSGPFRAYVDCTTDPFPEIEPEGDMYDIGYELLAALSVLKPLISKDASRPWSRGLLIAGGSAFATNNIILSEYWLGGAQTIAVNIPAQTVDEMLRINREPVRMQLSHKSATFYYSEDTWLTTSLLDLEWPEVRALLPDTTPDDNITLDEQFYAALDNVAPFTGKGNAVILDGSTMRTHADTDTGAAYQLEQEGMPRCAFSVTQLRALAHLTPLIGLSAYPRPCQWVSKCGAVRGAIAGMSVDSLGDL